jgi:hypothetical protein
MWPKNLAALCNFQKNLPKRKQSSYRRKFAQSGHNDWDPQKIEAYSGLTPPIKSLRGKNS